jgi:hypothetical protein
MGWMKPRLPAGMQHRLASLFSRSTASKLHFIRGVFGNTDGISPLSFINVSKNVLL